MYKFYKASNNQIIAYKHNESKNKTGITIVFLHGLMSNSEGSKALALYDYCARNDIDFISFDNFGHGKSSGDFKDQTIGSWLSGLALILNNVVKQDVILVGSSAGAWTALLGAKFFSGIKGLICIAPAPDFTESILHDLSEEQNKLMQKQGWIYYNAYYISSNLLNDAKAYLLLNDKSIKISCPVHIIHGIKDSVVPYSVSLSLVQKIQSNNAILKLIKEGDHSLSDTYFMDVIINSLKEMIEYC